MKGLRVTNIVKEIPFGGIWGELFSKVGFQRQSVTKYFRLTLALPETAHCGKSLICIFHQFFARIDKIFTSTGTLHTKVSLEKKSRGPKIFLK